MNALTKTRQIRDLIETQLSQLGPFEECALLDYPDYDNIGDHLIWLGTIFFLEEVLKIRIKYTSSIWNFSAQELEKNLSPHAPIFLQGGGNFGDQWIEFQKFREKIILRYPERPIIILPQTIGYKSQEKLEKAADILNSHPNLTLCVREDTSYEIAQTYFGNCQILKVPDMAFMLAERPEISFNFKPYKNYLYLSPSSSHNKRDYKTINLTELDLSDWISYQWISRSTIDPNSAIWKIPGLVRIYRELWQRTLSRPKDFLAQQVWQKTHPSISRHHQLYTPAINYYKSWDYLYAGMRQVSNYRLVITRRTHGHISCLLQGIPHIFAPGSYHKNESIYRTWTNQIPFCRWVDDDTEIKQRAEELLALYPNHQGLN